MDDSSITPLEYTCITCRVAFRSLDVQRQHYKSDWHRYNLKRKVAEFPPVSVEEFQRRIIAQQAANSASANGQETASCKPCKKVFNTLNQYNNHLVSKKHKERCAKSESESSTASSEPSVGQTSKKSNSDKFLTKAMPESLEDMELDTETESIDSDEWVEDAENPVENNNCLFCNHHSKSCVKNLKHMTEIHSFFIPDPEYCIDVKGLLEYLGEKVFVGSMCLWCNETGKAFQTPDAARAHMIDKGHCKMRHEGAALAEYAQFYDYSSSYPDAGDHDPDAEIEIPELDDTDYQLVLPSGNVIGHRSLMRYYKQSLDPSRALAITKNEKLRRVLCQYRAIGYSDLQKEAVIKKARDIKYMQRVQAKYSTQLQFKANKLQHHFRQQVNY